MWVWIVINALVVDDVDNDLVVDDVVILLLLLLLYYKCIRLVQIHSFKIATRGIVFR